jgi:hypothetical protein
VHLAASRAGSRAGSMRPTRRPSPTRTTEVLGQVRGRLAHLVVNQGNTTPGPLVDSGSEETSPAQVPSSEERPPAALDSPIVQDVLPDEVVEPGREVSGVGTGRVSVPSQGQTEPAYSPESEYFQVGRDGRAERKDCGAVPMNKESPPRTPVHRVAANPVLKSTPILQGGGRPASPIDGITAMAGLQGWSSPPPRDGMSTRHQGAGYPGRGSPSMAPLTGGSYYGNNYSGGRKSFDDRPRLRLPEWNGKQSFSQFVDLFERALAPEVLEDHQWTTRAFLGQFKGTTTDYVRLVPVNTAYPEAKRILRDILEPSTIQIEKLTEFDKRDRNPGETAGAYMGHLKVLCREGNPDMNELAVDGMTVRRFVRGLPRRLQKSVPHLNVLSTPSQVLDEITRAEAYQAMVKSMDGAARATAVGQTTDDSYSEEESDPDQYLGCPVQHKGRPSPRKPQDDKPTRRPPRDLNFVRRPPPPRREPASQSTSQGVQAGREAIRCLLDDPPESELSNDEDLWEEGVQEAISDHANCLMRQAYEKAGREAPENVTLVRDTDKCYNCNKPGHYARDCRSKARDSRYPTAYRPRGGTPKEVPVVDKKDEGQSGNSKGS